MKTKTLLLSLFSLCAFFAFSSTPMQAADDWAGYKRIERNRLVSIYFKVEHSKHGDNDSTVTWRGVNHTGRTLHVTFRPVYYGERDDYTDYISRPVFAQGSDATYLGAFSGYGKGLGYFTDIEIHEFEIREEDQYGDVIYRD